jgi:glycosyltransferase involved in cell wall biosynthesis
MKIAHVIHGFPPDSTAGSEVYTWKLALEQDRRNEVAVFSRTGDEKRKEYDVTRERCEGLDVWRINNTLKKCNSFEETYTNPPVLEIFKKFLDETQPDIVHIGHLTLLSTLIVDELKARGVPTIMTLHDYWLICPRGQLIRPDLALCPDPAEAPCGKCEELQLAVTATSRKAYNAYKKLTGAIGFDPAFVKKPLRKMYLALARKKGLTAEPQTPALSEPMRKRREHMRAVCGKIGLFVAPSSFLREKFIDFGVAADKIEYSDYGFDAAPFADFRRTPSDKVRFGFVGSLIPSKGVHVMLRAFRDLAHENAVLNIFGRFAPYYEFENYEKEIRKLANAPGINMRGQYDNVRVAEVFGEIDVLIVPSIWYENSPLAVHEAFLSRTPVITSNAGGMAELVRHEKSGLLFKMGNSASLRDAMARIVNEPRLVEKLRTGIPAVKTIQQDAEEMQERYEKLARLRG